MKFTFIKPAYAAITNNMLTTDPTSNPVAYTNKIIRAIIDIFLLVGVIYFIWHFVMAGYHFISSGGDSKKIEEAQHEITYAFVGLAIVLALFAILSFVGTVFGIDLTAIKWPSL